ncbi:hypothetical protein GPECTOR_60g701 [Gonium pectorale]|uniref:DNA-directed DNA polymerase n=1 Tax=Gonium pectorale TaxID=33097 RepID=A0A150G523_GONPE|nr:hypothetical protein GPECTOR_60g701 [Gonium pectorale]|eukprot:KXZ44924.1 hypothetical protein GPECTOR_60g701 [Gonium pectorale]
MDYVSEHSPDWLLGYNCFQFDNQHLAYFAPRRWASCFHLVASATPGDRGPACIITIPGCFNVDLMAYLDKTRRNKFTNLSLSVVARETNAGEKIALGSGHGAGDRYALLEYNLNDSALCVGIWDACSIWIELVGLSAAMHSCTIDVGRYATGVMSSALITSWYCHRGIPVPFTSLREPQPFGGAEVIAPKAGLWENVAVVDFTSLYPTVMAGANMGFESIRVCRVVVPKRGPMNVAIGWDDERVTFVFGDSTVVFARNPPSEVTSIVKYMIEQRGLVRKGTPEHFSYKVATNSIYGAMGFNRSAMYAPDLAQCVPAGGRWLLAFAEAVFKTCGLEVLYGDTDSCFVSGPAERSTNGARFSAGDVLTIINLVLDYTPFSMSKLRMEATYDRMVIVGKKAYYGTKEGSVHIAGISAIRKDRPALIRSMVYDIVDTLLKAPPCEIAQGVGGAAGVAVSLAMRGTLPVELVSKIVRYRGEDCYAYFAPGGALVYRPVATTDPSAPVEFDAAKVCASIDKEVQRHCGAVGYQFLSQVMAIANFRADALVGMSSLISA